MANSVILKVFSANRERLVDRLPINVRSNADLETIGFEANADGGFPQAAPAKGAHLLPEFRRVGRLFGRGDGINQLPIVLAWVTRGRGL